MSSLSTTTQDAVMRALRRVEKLEALQSSLTVALANLIDLGDSHQPLAHLFAELFMKTQEELQKEIADLRQAIIDDNTADQAVVTGLDTALDAAKKQLASQGTIDTDALFAAIDDAKAQIKPATSTSTTSASTGGETSVGVNG